MKWAGGNIFLRHVTDILKARRLWSSVRRYVLHISFHFLVSLQTSVGKDRSGR